VAKKPPPKSQQQPPPPQELLDRALQVVAARGWMATTLADLAEETGETRAEIYRRFGGKLGITDALSARADEAMLAVEEEEDILVQPPRDRLFEILMRRFDALAPHKDAVRAIMRAAPRDPALLVRGRCQLLRAMALALEAVGLSASGLRGAARTRLLTGAYLAAFRVWLTDDSPDLARTMAELDKRLRQLESLAGRFGGGGRGGGRRPEPAPQAP
jgi:AcrR family transcriptional regulator